MYKLNDIHNSDGKGNFEKMVISEAESSVKIFYLKL